MRIVNLASGSKGNATFVEHENTKLLIDAGISEKELAKRLGDIGKELSEIDAVLITHEHTDHVKAVKTLAKKYDINFYIETGLADSEFFKDVCFKDGKLHKILLESFVVGSIVVQPFAVSHDAISPVGYVLNGKGCKSKVGFATDLGIIDENVKNALKNAKLLFLEANYDENMLFAGNYPYIVKKRIASQKGHLSNLQALELADELYNCGTKCFVLSHISENNNTEEKAYSCFAEHFKEKGLSLDKDIYIRLSYQNKRGNNFVLKEE